MGKFWQIYAWGTIILTLILLAIIAFWEFYPYKTIEFKTSEFKVFTPIVKQGGTLRLESDYCKYVPISAVTGREFVNGLIFAVPESTTNREIGCHKIEFAVPVPKELPIGNYHLHNIYKYQVNPIREITVKQNSEQFEVVE